MGPLSLQILVALFVLSLLKVLMGLWSRSQASMVLEIQVDHVYLYFQAVLDILGNLGYHLSLSLPVYLLVPEVQDDLVNLRPQPCQSTPFHLFVPASRLYQDLLVSLWCLLLQLDLANREGQGNLVDPSVHDQADLYLPLNPLDRNSLVFPSVQGFLAVQEVLEVHTGHI